MRKKRPYKKKSKSHDKKSHDISDGDDPIAQQSGENSSYANFLDESHDDEAMEWTDEEEDDITMKPPPVKKVPPSLIKFAPSIK